MPEDVQHDLGHLPSPSTGLNGATPNAQSQTKDRSSAPVTNNEATATSRHSTQSGDSWPFSSESSDDNENHVGHGAVRVKTWRTRARRAFHMSSGFREGYGDDVRIDPIIESLDHRQQGYPKVAAFEDCDPSLLIFRKFGWLHNRVLLSLQDEIAELETKLKRYDAWDFANGDFRRLLSQRRDFQQEASVRLEMMEKLKKKLVEYDETLLRVSQIQSLRRPTARAQMTLFNLIKNTESLVQNEAEWIRHTPDLAVLAHDGEKGWFNGFLEDCLFTISKRWTLAIFRNSEQARQTGEEEFHLLTQKRLDVFLRVVLTILASILLLVPVFILFELQPSHPEEVRQKSNYQILVIFLFTLAFAASLSIFTRAKRQEVFQATAAYSAVLVIFLGNTSNVVVATNGLLD